MCLFPGKAKLNPEGGRPLFHPDGALKLPCGKCDECPKLRASAWGMRAQHEISLHNKNCFLTLTYNNQHSVTGDVIDSLPNTGGVGWKVFWLIGDDSDAPISVPSNGESIYLKLYNTATDGPSYGAFNSSQAGSNRPYVEILLSEISTSSTSTVATSTDSVDTESISVAFSLLFFFLGFAIMYKIIYV